MKMMPVIMTTMTLALGACDGAQQNDEAASADDSAQHRHLLDAAQQPLERAREAEDVSAARKSQIEEELKAAGDQ